MRLPARTDTSGGATAPAVAPPAPRDAAGLLLGRLSVLPTLLLAAWLLAGLPLLLAGRFTPIAMLAVSVPLAVAAVVLGLRWIPARGRAARPEDKTESARTPWWAVAAVVAVAVAFAVDQMIYHSQQIIVMRDPASYIQFGYWIAHHGSLPIPQSLAAFGGDHGLNFNTPGFYQVGSVIVPQFMAGLPMVLAPAFWIGGVAAAVAMAPLLGACGVLTFGGLAARLIGPRWAPLAALVLALSLPEQFTSRSAYSEPVAQIIFLGGLCLVIDSLDSDGAGARVLAALGGLAIGLTMLVRIDGASDLLPVIPYCGLLFLGRRRQAVPLLAGLVAGGLYGSIDGLVLSRPYLDSIRSSLEPLGLLTGLVITATLLAMALLWHRGVPAVRGRWLPNAVALLAFVVLAGFAIRPYVQTVRAPANSITKAVMAGFQRADHLPADPTRTYAELSLHWVFWYIGVPAVLLGTLGAALLSRRCLRGQAPAWTLSLVTFAWAIVSFLYRPAITPDQPWASRRLVPTVLPGFILLAVWATRWLSWRLRRMDTQRVIRAGLVACCVALLVLPPAITSFGLRLASGGPAGIRLAAVGLAVKKTYQGQIPAVDGMCAAIPRGSTVVFINRGDGDKLSEVVRGMCGEPAAEIYDPSRYRVERALQDIHRAGRRPVLLAASRSSLASYGGPIREIMALRSAWDAHTLTAPPLGTWPLDIYVWMSEPPT
jgi:hypothetical protein